MPKLNLAVLLSGGGTTLRNLLHCRDNGILHADIGLVVSSRPGVRGLDIARDAGIRAEVVDAKSFFRPGPDGAPERDWHAMSRELDRLVLAGGYDLVCMAGFLSRYIFSPELDGRVINIHPALIPMFCGPGMYGHHVHEAVVRSGVRVSGCTVHLADHAYDTGPIILQRVCPVYSDDDADAVAARVFREECIAYPAAVNLFAEGRIHRDGDGKIHIDNDNAIERFTSHEH